jgi:hypothetical protein
LAGLHAGGRSKLGILRMACVAEECASFPLPGMLDRYLAFSAEFGLGIVSFFISQIKRGECYREYDVDAYINVRGRNKETVGCC